MEAKLSPLNWIDFALLQSKLEVITPAAKGQKKKKLDPHDFFKKYTIDVDFANHTGDNGTFQTFTKVEINNGAVTKPGYKIFVEGTGVFRIDENAKLSESHKQNLQNYSAVNLLINRLRSHILQMTSMSLFGPYDLPPIDISDLYKQKRQIQQEERAD